MPVRPPAAIASRRTEGNQKRRRKRRFCGGRTEARPRASSLRVCLADIEKEPSSRKGAALSGSGHAGNFQAHAAEAIGESHRRANYNLPASRSARLVRQCGLRRVGGRLWKRSFLRRHRQRQSNCVAGYAARRLARAAPTAMLNSADTTVPTPTTTTLSSNIFSRSSGLTSPMYGATKRKSAPCSRPKTPPASAASVRSADFASLRERATQVMPTQQAISHATGVAQTTPGCRPANVTKRTAAVQTMNGGNTALSMALKSSLIETASEPEWVVS